MKTVKSATDYPCDGCGEPIFKGTSCTWFPDKGFYHSDCEGDAGEPPPADFGEFTPASPPTPSADIESGGDTQHLFATLVVNGGQVRVGVEVIAGIIAAGYEPCILCGEQLEVAESVVWVNHKSPPWVAPNEPTDIKANLNGLAHLQCSIDEFDEERTTVPTKADLRQAVLKAVLKALPGLTEDDCREDLVAIELSEDISLELNLVKGGVNLLVFENGVCGENDQLFVPQLVSGSAMTTTATSQVAPFLEALILPRLRRAWATHTAAIEHLERVLSFGHHRPSG